MLENRTMTTFTTVSGDVLTDVPSHRLSIVVPMYNEVENVEPFVTAVHEALADYDFPWELLISEDCSTDGTREIVIDYQRRHPERIRLLLSERNLRSNAEVLKTYWGWRPDDVLIHALPIFHVHGLFVALHGALINGSKMFWMSKFDPKLAIQKFAEATVFMGVPTLYVRMLAEPSLTKAQASGATLSGVIFLA